MPSSVYENSVREFMRQAGQPFGFDFYETPEDVLVRLAEAITSEADETADELYISDPEKRSKSRLAKELADVLYVVWTAAVALDIPLEPAFNLVHRSNMTKFNPETGLPLKDESGKVKKGPFYKAPDLSPLFKETMVER